MYRSVVYDGFDFVGVIDWFKLIMSLLIVIKGI